MYEYVLAANRYRDKKTGRFVSRERVLAYVEDIETTGAAAGDNAAIGYIDGIINANGFNLEMKEELKASYIQQATLGRGGRAAMTSEDWAYIGDILRGEYARIDKFTIELSAMSDDAIRARARNYFGASRQAFESMNARAYGVPRLPAYPGDFTSLCKNGCYCHWRIEKLKTPGDYDCYWELDPTANNCEVCDERSKEWNPIEVRAGKLGAYKEIHAHIHTDSVQL